MQETTQERANGQQQDNHDEVLLFSADKLAARLDISIRTLWRLRAAGKLPAPIRLGGSVRWRSDDIERWVTNGCPGIDTSQ